MGVGLQHSGLALWIVSLVPWQCFVSGLLCFIMETSFHGKDVG
jgi:hypothetical protein